MSTWSTRVVHEPSSDEVPKFFSWPVPLRQMIPFRDTRLKFTVKTRRLKYNSTFSPRIRKANSNRKAVYQPSIGRKDIEPISVVLNLLK